MQFSDFKTSYKPRSGYIVHVKKSDFTDNYIGIVYLTTNSRNKTRSIFNTSVSTIAELITSLNPYIELRNGSNTE